MNTREEGTGGFNWPGRETAVKLAEAVRDYDDSPAIDKATIELYKTIVDLARQFLNEAGLNGGSDGS